ncbi:MAG: helix-turn-helix domain-containing protein [Fibrobacter sp.]|nr:helix-turn-helix domain-containing protein [Fibrobacter sp.]
MVINVTRIECLLAERSMNKTELSSYSGVSRQSISAILKRGTCQPTTANKLARGLSVPLEEIVCRAEVVYR